MRLFDDLSLRWKIPLRVMVAVLGTALAVTLALLIRDYDDMRANLDAHAKGLGQQMASSLVGHLLHDDLWRAFEVLQSARGAGSELEAQIMWVLDGEQRVFVSSEPRAYPIGAQPQETNPLLAELMHALAGSDSIEQQVLESAQGAFRFVVSPLVADGVLLGHLVLGYAKAALVPRYLNLVTRAGLVTLAVLLVLLPISWVWAGRTARPLLQLARAMGSVPSNPAATDLGGLPRQGDEIGRLSQAFTRMIDELRHKQELESQMLVSERLAAVGRLAAGIAHEINNPLGGMLTAIQTYRRHSPADALAHQTLSLLERGLTQIRNTVAALLVETKIQDRPFEPADIDDLLLLVEAEAQSRAVQVQARRGLQQALPLPATLLRQVLLNLLLNAIAAADPGGRVQFHIDACAGRLRISVCNDGQHIPEARRSYLFEPFATGKEHGHGLGLWVVYQIVQQLKGDLTLESTPDCTRFKLEIRYAES